ncbi:MAG: hypothetical protein JWM14_3299 [Chitinophagaceae bacterium]|nr:hypothetical protein [Chitinophagaceae bacterium]
MSIGRLFNKENLSLSIFVGINFLFSIKYLSRVSAFYLPLSLFIACVYILLWYKRTEVSNFFARIHVSLNLLLILYVACCLVLLYFIPKESLRVDRWSVISSFWENYFHHQYVYYAKSFDGNYPGPMPFYFIVSLPFYLIGELGLFSLLGIALFVWLSHFNRQVIAHGLVLFLFIATSLFYFWEICSRSNIFANGAMVLLSVFYFFKYYKPSVKQNILFGLAIGLLLSTRNVFVISYLIMVLYALRIKKIDLLHTVILGVISCIVFVGTFLPFVWNHTEDFLSMNPFIIQSSFLMPFKYTLLFVFLSIAFSFFCKEERDVYFYIGVNLFLTILFYFFYTAIHTTFYEALIQSRADISYFILCVPFFMLYLFFDVKRNSNKSGV